MSTTPQFWKEPYRFLRHATHVKPHYVVAIGLAVLAPALGLFVTPLRRKYLYSDAPQIPLSYPVPNRSRENLTGYDDPQ